MKFVYFGYDFMLPAVERLVSEGHQLLGVFSFPCDNAFNFNTRAQALARHLRVPFSIEKPDAGNIDSFIQQGCECFLSAGYPYKIPPIDETRARGINLHPSLLPQGRGLMPTPHIILDQPQASGITVHKLTQNFDQGDILHQTALPISSHETVETLSARVAMRAPDILSMIFSDFPTYWNDAKPQNEKKASWFPAPDQTMRTLDWTQNVAKIDRTARAFGRYGSLARFDDDLWVVYAHDFWEEKHNMKPGTVAARLSREIVIAARDGFICLKDFHKAQIS